MTHRHTLLYGSSPGYQRLPSTLQKSSYEQTGGGKASMGLSEVLARIRQDHQRELLRAACAEVAGGASVEEVVTRYAGPAIAPAA